MAAEDPSPPLTIAARLRRLLVGAPRDLADRSLFHRMSLIPFLAWVGLGADGLSSSAYGPEEAFRQLGQHRYLAVALAALMATTVLLISAAYSRIIDEFPHGGGGYVVATKLLGERVGVVSGCALVVDYVLTITISIAAAGDALFSFLPRELHTLKPGAELALIGGLTLLNLRGVRESVLALMPVFLLFLVTHALLIGAGVVVHAPELPQTARSIGQGFSEGLSTLGLGGMLLVFMRAYSLGGGTYTGIEAVSNGLPIMREPRVQTARRTMVYMGTSLALTASGLLLCYLLWRLEPVEGKTLNAVFVERLVAGLPGGTLFVVLTLLTEGALLIVAAQAGFLDGPRVLSNMAIDSWAPRRFASLSERLTTANGILLMGGASLVALLYTRGDVRHLVVMYSINVFVTFSLSLFAMARAWLQRRRTRPEWRRRVALFGSGFVLCATILVVTAVEKFAEGGWITLLVTALLVALCFVIRRHYATVAEKLRQLYDELGDLPEVAGAPPDSLDPSKPVAAVLVSGYGGLGIHTVLNIFRHLPGYYGSLVFLSVGVIDSGEFKGEGALESLRERTGEMLARYVELAHKLELPATYRLAVGTDAVEEAERLCLEVARELGRVHFYAGKVIFQRERWYQRLLHNETALAIQKRLQWHGLSMQILPARVR